MTSARAGLTGIAILAFFSLGLPDGVLGVAWPSMRGALELGMAELGGLLVAAMVGYLVSASASGTLVARLGVGRLLVISSLVMTASSLGYAMAPGRVVVLGAALLAGLGGGAIDAGINAYAARRFPPRLVTWLHACYGVGAMLGPLLITGVLASGWSGRVGYAILALALPWRWRSRRPVPLGTPRGHDRPARGEGFFLLRSDRREIPRR